MTRIAPGVENATETPLSEDVAHHVIALPRLRSVLAHASQYLLLGSLIPMGLFYSSFNAVGLHVALIIVLAWSLSLITHRVVGARRIEATLIMSTVLMLVRITATWCTGSTFIYLVQPLVGTFVTAAALIGSVVIRKPFTERVTRDFVPLPPSLAMHPKVTSCFCTISLVWGAVYVVNGTLAFWMLTHNSMGDFMLLSKVVGLGMSAFALLVSIAIFFRAMRSERIKLTFGAASTA